MRILLFLSAVIVFLIACMQVLLATSAAREIAGYVLFLTSAVLMSGAGIVEAVNRLHKTVQDSASQQR